MGESILSGTGNAVRHEREAGSDSSTRDRLDQSGNALRASNDDACQPDESCLSR